MTAAIILIVLTVIMRAAATKVFAPAALARILPETVSHALPVAAATVPEAITYAAIAITVARSPGRRTLVYHRSLASLALVKSTVIATFPDTATIIGALLPATANTTASGRTTITVTVPVIDVLLTATSVIASAPAITSYVTDVISTPAIFIPPSAPAVPWGWRS